MTLKKFHHQWVKCYNRVYNDQTSYFPDGCVMDRCNKSIKSKNLDVENSYEDVKLYDSKREYAANKFVLLNKQNWLKYVEVNIIDRLLFQMLFQMSNT